MPTTVTKTVKPSGGDYTSLSSWEAGQQGDLVTADQISQAECYSMSDTTAVTIDGWTTDSTRYIRVYTPSAERHNGKWNTGKYRLEASRNNDGALTVVEDYVYVEGLQISQSGATSASVVRFMTSVGRFDFLSNVIKHTNATKYFGLNLDINGVNATVNIVNNVIYDCLRGIYWDYGNAINGVVYNNTVVDCNTGSSPTGIWLKGTAANNNLSLNNNICQGNTVDYSVLNLESSATNLSEDATSPQTALRNKVVTFVDELNDDFHLASGDTSAKDAGTDLSGDASYAFSIDIDGQTRSGTWDIGADEVVSGGGFQSAWAVQANQILQPGMGVLNA